MPQRLPPQTLDVNVMVVNCVCILAASHLLLELRQINILADYKNIKLLMNASQYSWKV